MATTSTQSLLDQLLDKFECWMTMAEFGTAANLPQTPTQTADE